MARAAILKWQGVERNLLGDATDRSGDLWKALILENCCSDSWEILDILFHGSCRMLKQ